MIYIIWSLNDRADDKAITGTLFYDLSGAQDENRTHDLRITSALLYPWATWAGI